MPTILIVDDDAAVREILVDLLSENYECNTASTAEQAIQYLEIENYDAVLTDLAMPGLTGVEILKRLKLKDLRTPVIIISGKPQEEDRMLSPQGFYLTGGFEALQRVFTNGLQHQQAWLAIGLRLLPEQALVHQSRHCFKQTQLGVPVVLHRFVVVKMIAR